MIKLQRKEHTYDYDQLLQDLVGLLEKDPDDKLAAGYVCWLLKEGIIPYGIARKLYKEAISTVYFDGKKHDVH
jgi:hypothetical protein